jgi:hypothetical protein
LDGELHYGANLSISEFVAPFHITSVAQADRLIVGACESFPGNGSTRFHGRYDRRQRPMARGLLFRRLRLTGLLLKELKRYE